MSGKKSISRITRLSARQLSNFEGHLQRIYRENGSVEAGLNLVYAYEGQGKFDEALRLLDAMHAKANPQLRLVLFMRQGEVCAAADRLDEARGYFEKASDGGMDEALLALARLNFDAGELGVAESYARRAATAGVKESGELLGDILAYQDNWEGALAQFEHLYSSDSKIAGKLGVCLMNVHRAEEAIPYLRESIASGNLAMTRRLVEAYYWIGKYRNGIIYGEMGLRQKLNDLYGLVGLCHMRLKDYASGARCLEQSLRRHEKVGGAHLALGKCYVELGRKPEALKCLRQAARRKEPNAWYAMGLLYKELEDFAAARRCFRKSLEQEEDQAALSSFELGGLCAMRHDEKGAEMHYQDAWLGGCMKAGVSLGLQAMLHGDVDRGIAYFHKLLELGQTDVLAKLGMAYLMKDDLDKGREFLLRAHEAGLPEASLGLAVVNKKEGNNEEADRFFEESIESGVPGTLRQYGNDLLERGDYLSAVGYLSRAWEEEHDREALVPLSYAYFSLDPNDHVDAVLHYLDLATREGCLSEEGFEKMVQKMSKELQKLK